jgi:hypothetical protein
MNRLTTVWLNGAGSLGTSRPNSAVSHGRSVHHYRVDGPADERLIWIETGAGQNSGWSQADVPPAAGEVFSFDLARDVGVKLKTPAPWLYIVHTDIPADVVADYNAWYDEEHLPRLVGVPGIERARRYVAHGDLSPRYLTAYDLTIKDAFESPAGLVARKTPWTERMRSLFQNTRRKMCALQQ